MLVGGNGLSRFEYTQGVEISDLVDHSVSVIFVQVLYSQNVGVYQMCVCVFFIEIKKQFRSLLSTF